MRHFDKAIQAVDRCMKELNIKYAFISGTALGLCREGKCMEYDTDIDFCIHTDNRNKLDEIVSKIGLNRISEMRFGNRLEAIGFGFGENNQEWVELDLLHTRGDKVWYSAFVGHGSPWITKVYPKHMWDTLEYIYAYDVNCPVFSPIEEYCRMCYGNDWETPNKMYFHQELFRKMDARHYDWDLTED